MKLLYITTIARSHFGGFAKSSIMAAKQANVEYSFAANESGIDQQIKDAECRELGIRHVHIDIDRNPFAISKNMKAYHQLVSIMKNENFDIIHCNTPMGGVLGRLASWKTGIKNVIYQAHGFHFWKGAPLKNWLLYYPVEKMLSRWTDILITINKSDYEIALKCFTKPQIKYVHGVGVDLAKYSRPDCAQPIENQIKKELGIDADDILMLSVGELNQNKNHEVVIRALAKLGNNKVHYAIAGVGPMLDKYVALAKKLDISKQIHFLGFRSDMPTLYRSSDLFVFPSKREGLPGALMEAMASELPCIVSKIRGNIDLIEHDVGGFLFNALDVDELARCISKMLKNSKSWPSMAAANREKVQRFELKIAVAELSAIYAQYMERE